MGCSRRIYYEHLSRLDDSQLSSLSSLSRLCDPVKPSLSPLRLWLFFHFLLITGTGFAQYNTNFLSYSNTGRSISAFMEFEAGSNGVNGSLANRLIWGGHISNE